MTDKTRTARALLGDQDLIGFVPSKSDGQHMVQRASSANVDQRAWQSVAGRFAAPSPQSRRIVTANGGTR